ncbi:hypothetical protein LXL04_035199 [Taraxacum kok-saghyz]
MESRGACDTGAVCYSTDSDSDSDHGPRTTDRVRHQTRLSNASDHGPSPTSEAYFSVCDFFGRTESEAKGRTESVVRVRRTLSNAQTTDRVRGPSLSLWSDTLANSPNYWISKVRAHFGSHPVKLVSSQTRLHTEDSSLDADALIYNVKPIFHKTEIKRQ